MATLIDRDTAQELMKKGMIAALCDNNDVAIEWKPDETWTTIRDENGATFYLFTSATDDLKAWAEAGVEYDFYYHAHAYPKDF